MASPSRGSWRGTDRTPAPAPARADQVPGDGAIIPGRSRILIVDDEPMLAGALARAIGGGHDVSFARDGAEAQAILSADQGYELILCDLVMPGISGPSLFAWLEEACPELCGRVVFMTGGTFTSEAAEFVAAKPNRCLHKPFDWAQVRAVVAEIVGGA